MESTATTLNYCNNLNLTHLWLSSSSSFHLFTFSVSIHLSIHPSVRRYINRDEKKRITKRDKSWREALDYHHDYYYCEGVMCVGMNDRGEREREMFRESNWKGNLHHVCDYFSLLILDFFSLSLLFLSPSLLNVRKLVLLSGVGKGMEWKGENEFWFLNRREERERVIEVIFIFRQV